MTRRIDEHDDPDIVEEAQRYLAFWGDGAAGKPIVMVRGLVVEIIRLRSILSSLHNPSIEDEP